MITYDPHTQAAIDRVRAELNAGAQLPRADGLHTFPCEELKTGRCVCVRDERLNRERARRLALAILTEGYGGVQLTTTNEPRKGEYPLPDGADLAECRSCGAAIVWTRTSNGRAMPLSVATVVEREGQKWALSHFADCAHSRDWSRKK